MGGYRNKRVYTSRVQSVDFSTGEVLSDTNTSVVVSRHNEQFAMYSTTDGLDWAKPFKSYLLLMMLLNIYADRDNVVSLSVRKRKKICDFFGWSSVVSLSNALGVLISLDGLRRISQNDFMLNPNMFYRGSVLSKASKVEMFNSLVKG